LSFICMTMFIVIESSNVSHFHIVMCIYVNPAWVPSFHSFQSPLITMYILIKRSFHSFHSCFARFVTFLYRASVNWVTFCFYCQFCKLASGWESLFQPCSQPHVWERDFCLGLTVDYQDWGFVALSRRGDLGLVVGERHNTSWLFIYFHFHFRFLFIV